MTRALNQARGLQINADIENEDLPEDEPKTQSLEALRKGYTLYEVKEPFIVNDAEETRSVQEGRPGASRRGNEERGMKALKTRFILKLKQGPGRFGPDI
ncbi:hypothetical protein NDN08_005007 [Rhodosorus marinus]|uniref:Uncharacterized protein n=1 Tax=Rhodosorus marinus TaxID=101924 RepID=A0AAV8UJ09_9RHOD|nr:hypothetical protein NDN08_005007 [Rhodosorus marinus]